LSRSVRDLITPARKPRLSGIPAGSNLGEKDE